MHTRLHFGCHTPPGLTRSYVKFYIRSHIRHILHRPFFVQTHRVLCSILVVESWQRNTQYKMNRRSGMEGRLGVGGGMVSEESQRKQVVPGIRSSRSTS